ncbi:MAG: hypothetical protein RL281_1713 [Pseudomonadota bacterium]
MRLQKSDWRASFLHEYRRILEYCTNLVLTHDLVFACSRRGVGAVSTQALMNPLFGPLGIKLMQSGMATQQVMQDLLKTDAGSDQRQVHLLPLQGEAVAHTGKACIDWCGHVSGQDFSIAGNMLAGPQVVAETARVFQATQGMPLAERLILAMLFN